MHWTLGHISSDLKRQGRAKKQSQLEKSWVLVGKSIIVLLIKSLHASIFPAKSRGAGVIFSPGKPGFPGHARNHCDN
jgi:hypothetical protein